MRDQYNNCNFYGSSPGGDVYIDFTTLVFVAGCLVVGWLAIEGLDYAGSYLALKAESVERSAIHTKAVLSNPDVVWYLKAIGLVLLPFAAGVTYLVYRFRPISFIHKFLYEHEEDTFL